MNDWRYDRSTIARKGEILENNSRTAGYPLYSFLSTLNSEEADEFAIFETKFKKFMYGGVSVQRLLPNAPPTRSGMTQREKRTLWLMLPEVGSLRLGYVSKLKDDNGYATDEMSSLASSTAPSRNEDNVRLLKLITAYVCYQNHSCCFVSSAGSNKLPQYCQCEAIKKAINVNDRRYSSVARPKCRLSAGLFCVQVTLLAVFLQLTAIQYYH